METSSRLHFFEKKLLVRSKQVISTLVLIYFSRPGLGHAIKTNYITLPIVESEIYSILILYKRVWD